ncbi:hypothetical protein AAMO2058_000872900 [Amorphochlora amoebiformis]
MPDSRSVGECATQCTPDLSLAACNKHGDPTSASIFVLLLSALCVTISLRGIHPTLASWSSVRLNGGEKDSWKWHEIKFGLRYYAEYVFSELKGGGEIRYGDELRCREEWCKSCDSAGAVIAIMLLAVCVLIVSALLFVIVRLIVRQGYRRMFHTYGIKSSNLRFYASLCSGGGWILALVCVGWWIKGCHMPLKAAGFHNPVFETDTYITATETGFGMSVYVVLLSFLSWILILLDRPTIRGHDPTEYFALRGYR